LDGVGTIEEVRLLAIECPADVAKRLTLSVGEGQSQAARNFPVVAYPLLNALSAAMGQYDDPRIDTEQRPCPKCAGSMQWFRSLRKSDKGIEHFFACDECGVLDILLKAFTPLWRLWRRRNESRSSNNFDNRA
jgi:hypothetical protein